jgi:hypothetical protein
MIFNYNRPRYLYVTIRADKRHSNVNFILAVT